nr:hypothetical protein [Nocardia transvalensis]
MIPSPPVLVPELCGGTPVADAEHPAAQVPGLREAVLTAGRTLAASASRWTVVGTGETDATFGPNTAGTFRGYGVDVRVALSPSAPEAADPVLALSPSAPATADPELPLAALLGGWLRGQVAPDVVAEARILDGRAAPGRCAEVGAALRRDLDASSVDHGVLVVADGAATLSTRAPGYLDPRAEGVQEEIDRALAAGDRDALAALDPLLCAELEVSGRAAFQALAGLFGADATGPGVETLYRAAPFGVGYQVCVWRPGAAS